MTFCNKILSSPSVDIDCGISSCFAEFSAGNLKPISLLSMNIKNIRDDITLGDIGEAFVTTSGHYFSHIVSHQCLLGVCCCVGE